MKIDNCDPPFLPGKQKWRVEVVCEGAAFINTACAPGSIMPEVVEKGGGDGGGESSVTKKRTR